MGTSPDPTALIRFDGGDPLLVERLRDPVQRALGERRTCYFVHIERVGRAGEVLVSVTGSRGRLPLLLRGEEELEAGYVHRVLSDTVSRFDI